jgi:Ni,Fe-hydrogenase I large subunit
MYPNCYNWKLLYKIWRGILPTVGQLRALYRNWQARVWEFESTEISEKLSHSFIEYQFGLHEWLEAVTPL